MRNLAFRALLDLLMISDPWPLDEKSHDELRCFADKESRLRGHDDWIEAYHDYKLIEKEK